MYLTTHAYQLPIIVDFFKLKLHDYFISKKCLTLMEY